jgi:hypothetical protein
MSTSRFLRPGVVAAMLWLLLSGCSLTTEPAEDILTFQIAPALVPCSGYEGQTTCYRVRESADAPWSYFYEWIDGFTYEPGYLYTVRVARRVITNPMADEPNEAYRLLEILSKVPG